jgi:asparagine synthase (glutamine-hydrolysing)
MPAIFGATLRDLPADLSLADEPLPGNRSALGEALAFDLRHYLPALLQVEDRMSMAWGLESRVPLLDHRLVEAAMRIPPAIKLHGLEPKHILRRAVADLLPPAVAARRDKKGFPTPIGPWFRGELQPWLREQLTGPAAEARCLFDTAAVQRLVDEHAAGTADHSRPLWMLLNTHQWYEVFVEGKAPAPATAAPAARPSQTRSTPQARPPGAAHGR